MLPPDIDPESRCRLPIVKREDLDAMARRPTTCTPIRRGHDPGSQGARRHRPAFLKTRAYQRPVGRYLRFESGHSPRVRETAILISARESNSQFEWAAHEPEALKEGVPRATIDAIKYRKPLDGLDPLTPSSFNSGARRLERGRFRPRPMRRRSSNSA